MTALPDCQALDAADVLASKRAEFKIPAGKIYLNGNSLGPLPVRALAHSLTLIEQQWGEDLISSWNKHGSGLFGIGQPDGRGRRRGDDVE